MGEKLKNVSVSDAETEVFEDRRFLPPVPSIDELPLDGIREGDMCIVQDDGSVYEFRNGIWEMEVTGGVILD